MEFDLVGSANIEKNVRLRYLLEMFQSYKLV